VVITAVFNAYFVAVVPAARALGDARVDGDAAAVSYALIVLTAPLIGAWADARAAKKRLLAFTTVGCVLFTAALYFAGPGTLALASAAVIAVELLLRHRREPDRRLPAGTGRGAAPWAASPAGAGASATSAACSRWAPAWPGCRQAKAAGRETAQFVPRPC
jgi:UMF1 family MFS transporter